MNRTRKPVHIQTSNKWSTRTECGGDLEVELDRLTIKSDKEKLRKMNNVIKFIIV